MLYLCLVMSRVFNETEWIYVVFGLPFFVLLFNFVLSIFCAYKCDEAKLRLMFNFLIFFT